MDNQEEQKPKQANKFTDEQVRYSALGLAVESLKAAGQPPVIEVLNRADRFAKYIQNGSIDK